MKALPPLNTDLVKAFVRQTFTEECLGFAIASPADAERPAKATTFSLVAPICSHPTGILSEQYAALPPITQAWFPVTAAVDALFYDELRARCDGVVTGTVADMAAGKVGSGMHMIMGHSKLEAELAGPHADFFKQRLADTFFHTTSKDCLIGARKTCTNGMEYYGADMVWLISSPDQPLTSYLSVGAVSVSSKTLRSSVTVAFNIPSGARVTLLQIQPE